MFGLPGVFGSAIELHRARILVGQAWGTAASRGPLIYVERISSALDLCREDFISPRLDHLRTLRCDGRAAPVAARIGVAK